MLVQLLQDYTVNSFKFQRVWYFLQVWPYLTLLMTTFTYVFKIVDQMLNMKILDTKYRILRKYITEQIASFRCLRILSHPPRPRSEQLVLYILANIYSWHPVLGRKKAILVRYDVYWLYVSGVMVTSLQDLNTWNTFPVSEEWTASSCN